VSNSVTRALRILDLLAKAEKPLSLTQIAESLDIPKSTAHSILRDLAREAFIDVHNPVLYSIGLKSFEVGSAYLRLTGAVGVVAPELVRLTQSLNLTSHYAVLDKTDAVYLCKEDPPGLGVKLASSIGARLPSHLTAVGKSCLAWLENDTLAEHVSLSDAEELGLLDKELVEIRERGYATDDGGAAAGIQCVAAPVFGLSGSCGAIGVSYLGGAASTDGVAVEVVRAAAQASALLGGKAER
jgi:DNA-binding IclR family transcriptional regulator